jgi:hypothetical protein
MSPDDPHEVQREPPWTQGESPWVQREPPRVLGERSWVQFVPPWVQVSRMGLGGEAKNFHMNLQAC